MILVKVIFICGLHVFFHQYVADLRERKSENVFRTVSTSPLMFDMTVMRTSGVIATLPEVPVRKILPLTTVVSIMDAVSMVTPFVVPPAPEIERPVMQAQDFSNCRLTKSRKFLSLFRLLTSSPAPTLPRDSAKDSSPFLSLDRVPPLRGNKSPPAGEALLQPLTDDCVASGLGLLCGVNSIRGQNPLGLCLDVRLSGLYCQPDPPVLPTGSALRISTPLLEGSSTSASDYSRSCRVVRTDTRSPAICCVPVETQHKDCCRILFSPWSTRDVGSRSISSLGVAFMFGLGILFRTSCYSSV